MKQKVLKKDTYIFFKILYLFQPIKSELFIHLANNLIKSGGVKVNNVQNLKQLK